MEALATIILPGHEKLLFPGGDLCYNIGSRRCAACDYAIVGVSSDIGKGERAMLIPLDAKSITEIVWLVLLILFAASEAITVGLTSIWFAAGALVALIAALLGGPVWVQITLFLAISLLCLAAVRPLAKKHLNDKVVPTNADRAIGEEIPVTQDIDNLRGRGAVVIRGMTWSARSQDGSAIPAGTMVKVLRIEGVRVFVEPVPVPVSAGEPKTW